MTRFVKIVKFIVAVDSCLRRNDKQSSLKIWKLSFGNKKEDTQMTMDIIERIEQEIADWKHTRLEKAVRRKKVELQILRRRAERMQLEISGMEYDLRAGG